MSWKSPALAIARWNFFKTTSSRSVSFSVTSIDPFQSETPEPETTLVPQATAQVLDRSTGPAHGTMPWPLRSHEGVLTGTAKSSVAVERTRVRMQLSRPMRPFFILLGLGAAAAACRPPHPANSSPPVRTTRDTARVTRQPVLVRDTALEQRAARLELKVLEQGAQVEELQTRLDDARREVVRAMAKLQSLATRAEAASGMAEAEIALQALRTNGGANSSQPSPELLQGNQLLQLASSEFDKQNYAGALYLATEAKNAAAAGQGRARGGDDPGSGANRKGETPFALPLRLQTTGRANVREGPGAGFKVLFTLETAAPVVAYSYVDQWVRIKDDGDRSGWIHQTLIGRRGGP